MQNPSPINLKSSSEVRAEGWQAETRDADGHLCSTHALPAPEAPADGEKAARAGDGDRPAPAPGPALWTEAEKGALVDAAARGASVAELMQRHGRTEIAIRRKLKRLSAEIEAARAELEEGAVYETPASAPEPAHRMPAADRTCAVPGCDAPLTRANRTE